MANDSDSTDFLDNVVNAPTANPTEGDEQPSKEYILSDSEKKLLLAKWNAGESRLKSLINALFPGEDGRTKRGLAVKKYLASCNMNPTAIGSEVPKSELIELSKEDKEFIRNNAADMKPLEMTRILFGDQSLTPLSAQARVVRKFYLDLSPEQRGKSPLEVLDEYIPPKDDNEALITINKYILNGLDADKLTVQHKEWLLKIRKVLNTHRFLFEVNNLPSSQERELFLSSFVRFIYDKPDLTEEEIDIYLNQCSDIVGYQRMQSELFKMIECKDQMMDNDGKIPMAVVESIGKLRGDIDANLKRQAKTLTDLNGKRADRLTQLHTNNESILKLVEAFRSEASRKRMLKTMEMRKKEVSKEAERLFSVDALRFELFGATPEELI